MHVFADLQPYLCTFDECALKLKAYPKRLLWADHELREHFTEKLWRCSYCSQIEQNPESYRQHLQQVHKYALTNESLSQDTHKGKAISLKPVAERQCPLCQRGSWESYRTYFTHVGKHLEEIALASLPRDVEDNDGEDTDERSADGSSDIELYPQYNIGGRGDRLTELPSLYHPMLEDRGTLFVGNLGYDVDQESLANIFGEYGKILHISFGTNRATRAIKGYAFIKFSSVEESRAAIEKLQGIEIARRPVYLDKVLETIEKNTLAWTRKAPTVYEKLECQTEDAGDLTVTLDSAKKSLFACPFYKLNPLDYSGCFHWGTTELNFMFTVSSSAFYCGKLDFENLLTEE